jgi:hypothetical protein
MNVFTAPYFQDAEAARKAFEMILWPNGPVCPHCGETERRYATKRPGRYRCNNPACRKDFTVTTGTVMERSHIPLNKWLLGYYLVRHAPPPPACSSAKPYRPARSCRAFSSAGPITRSPRSAISRSEEA